MYSTLNPSLRIAYADEGGNTQRNQSRGNDGYSSTGGQTTTTYQQYSPSDKLEGQAGQTQTDLLMSHRQLASRETTMKDSNTNMGMEADDVDEL